MFKNISRQLRDKIAIALSMLCVLQCLFLPFVIMALPFLDIWWLSDEFLHPFLLLVVIPLTLLTLIPAFRHHKRLQPLIIATPALILLSIGAFIPVSNLEKMLTIVGAITLATAHIRNIILNKPINHQI